MIQLHDRVHAQPIYSFALNMQYFEALEMFRITWSDKWFSLFFLHADSLSSIL